MPMSHEDLFKAVLNMVQVTPENYLTLNAGMILHVYKVVAEAEELSRPASVYDGLTAEQIKERQGF